MAMNPTLSAIQNVIKKNMAVYLPDVSPESLEDGGKIFYMNGKDGTEFDWFVNGRLCPFMVFYDDEDNLGAVKALVAKNGEISGRSVKFMCPVFLIYVSCPCTAWLKTTLFAYR